MKKPTRERVRPKVEAGPKHTVDRAWIKNRLRELGIPVQNVAEAFGTYPVLLWRMTTGERRAQPADILKWSDILQVPPLLMFEKFGIRIPAPTVPIIGAVRRGGRVAQFAPKEVRRTDAPIASAPDMVALVVETADTELGLYDGATLYYEPAEGMRPDAIGRLCLVKMADHAAPVVGVLDRGTIDRVRVRVWGDTETIESRQLTSATPIRWMRAG